MAECSNPGFENHYRVHISYAPIPGMEELKKEWGDDNVEPIFDGRPFTLYAHCIGMDRSPGERILYLHDAGYEEWREEDLIIWGLRQRSMIAPNGYRPATEQEVYEFAKAHPELSDFVGLGSSTTFGGRGNRYVACVLTGYDNQRALARSPRGDRRPRDVRILFVCK